MYDPFLTRTWSNRHGRFSSDLTRGLRRLARTVAISMDRLHHRNFDAPWQIHHRRPHRAGQ